MNITAALGWAWVIIVGGLMITPRGPICIVCGDGINIAVAVITILVGAVGLVTAIRNRNAAMR